MPREIDVPVLVDAMRDGDRRALARLLTCVENGHQKLAELGGAVTAHTGHAQIVGLTGPPGVGKSTTTNALVAAYRAAGSSVAVLAVDPSSPFSGGALLGDRIRMNAIHAPQIYMRSLATREAGKEISNALPDVIAACKVAGFDLIIVETSGIGQGDAAITPHVDISLYVMTPEFGAASQLEKIDMLDFADLVAINKFDRRGAQDAQRDVGRDARKLMRPPGSDGGVLPLPTNGPARGFPHAGRRRCWWVRPRWPGTAAWRWRRSCRGGSSPCRHPRRRPRAAGPCRPPWRSPSAPASR